MPVETRSITINTKEQLKNSYSINNKNEELDMEREMKAEQEELNTEMKINQEEMRNALQKI